MWCSTAVLCYNGPRKRGVIRLGEDVVAVEPWGHRVANQVTGLLIFFLGVGLLVFVFMWAHELYRGLDAPMFGVHPVTEQPQVAGTPKASPLPPGAVKAEPRTVRALTPTAMALLAKLLALIVMAWVAALVAGKGITLAVSACKRE